MVEGKSGFDGSKRIEIPPVGPDNRINIGRGKPLSAEAGKKMREAGSKHFSVLNEQRDVAIENVKAKIEEVGGESHPADHLVVDPEAGRVTAQIARQTPAKKPGMLAKAIKFFKGGK